MNIDDAWDLIGIAIDEKGRKSDIYYSALIEVRNDVALKNIALHKITNVFKKYMCERVYELPKAKAKVFLSFSKYCNKCNCVEHTMIKEIESALLDLKEGILSLS